VEGDEAAVLNRIPRRPSVAAVCRAFSLIPMPGVRAQRKKALPSGSTGLVNSSPPGQRPRRPPGGRALVFGILRRSRIWSERLLQS